MPPLAPNAWLRYDVVRRELDHIAGRGGDLGDVLEVGAGQGSVGTRLSLRSRYTGVDLDARSAGVATERLRAAGHGGRMLCGSLDEVLTADERFDVLCAFEVLEHIRDDGSALREWRERLRPGGHLLVSTPARAANYRSADRMAGHFRRYDPETLAAALTAAGFADVRLVCYGVPLGVALEAGRNAIAARRGFSRAPGGLPSTVEAPLDDDDSALRAELEGNTRASGRLLQPGPGLAPLVQAGTLPFRLMQRRFPARGPGVVASARRVG